MHRCTPLKAIYNLPREILLIARQRHIYECISVVLVHRVQVFLVFVPISGGKKKKRVVRVIVVVIFLGVLLS